MSRFALAMPLLAVVLAGCAGTLAPQSRPEYIQRIRDGGAFLMVDSHVANRGIEQVVATLRQKSRECLTGESQVRRSSGGITTMQLTNRYLTTVRSIDAGHAELTTQFNSVGKAYVQQVPDGGFYERAVDIERLSATTTRLTYYGSSFDDSKKAWSALKEWSDGRTTPCPG